MFDLVEREVEIIEVLNGFTENNLDFIVVGGYAVSAYKRRFSIDADVVIKKEDRAKFEDILKKRGYRKGTARRLEDAYSSEYARYDKPELRTGVDLLIGGIVSRQTGASFGIDLLWSNSDVMEIRGSMRAVNARVPNREMLIAMKLHSGRLTDFRDVIALAYNLDIDKIRRIISRGDRDVLKRHIKSLGEMAGKQDFQDSFKGVFQEKNYRIDMGEVKKLLTLI